MKIRCNSCGATWPKEPPKGSTVNPHVCPDELIETHATCDDKGNVLTPAKFRPVTNPRNENLMRHPERPNEFVLVSEGEGVTEIE